MVLAVVASVTGPTAASDRTFLDGMRLAERQVGAGRGIGRRDLALEVADDRGDPPRARSLLEGILRANDAAAVLVVGDGRALVMLRRQVEAFGGPAVLLSGDLYSSRSLYRQVFQTSVPVLWQSRAIARYLVRDRRYERVVLATETGRAPASREAFDSAMAEEGGDVALRVSVRPGGGLRAVSSAARDADAVVFLGDSTTAARLARTLARKGGGPQLVVSSDALSPEFAAAGPRPGTVAPYPYTWAGWAQVIPRVREFRSRFREAFERLPTGREQEGYDAVRALVASLRRTRGRGGRRLVRAMEALPWRPYSSLPVQLGPDDHVFPGQNEVGLFAVPGEDERTEPWVGPRAPWRPIMRTFTPDLERTGILDLDRRVFFPRWRENRPAPDYWRSRYGIVTRPRRDPLH
ncbi:MAG TPA: ABC transporter substrate-binding protein [Actinomycetota bacterium]|nr:ABC transporter substrate-binding protein [Actinomycetota bacterium]